MIFRSITIAIILFVAALVSSCGTTTSGRLTGNQYVSKSGDIACTFPGVTADVSFTDFSGSDGEWVSNNFSGVDIERIERFQLGSATISSVKSLDGFVDTILPQYTTLSERVKAVQVLVRKPVQINGKAATYTYIEFKTFTPDDRPQSASAYRGILWMIGDKYATTIHAYNWKMTAKDADRVEAQLAAIYKRCTFRG